MHQPNYAREVLSTFEKATKELREAWQAQDLQRLSLFLLHKHETILGIESLLKRPMLDEHYKNLIQAAYAASISATIAEDCIISEKQIAKDPLDALICVEGCTKI